MAIALHHPLTNSQPLPPVARGFARRAADGIARLVVLWLEHNADLRIVEQLEERDLRDMGASRWELRRELARPFWRG